MKKDFSEVFNSATAELESLAAEFAVPATTPGYEGVWLPADNTVRMWTVPRPTAEFLYEQIHTLQPKTVLELGTSSGYSALWMGEAAKTYGGKIYTIEMAQPKIDIAQSYIDAVGHSDTTSILKGEIHDVLKAWDKEIDFVFLDADKHNYLSYITAMNPYLKPGSVVIADNAIDFGYLMEDYLSYMTGSGDFESEMIKKDNGLLYSKKK